MQFRNVQGRGKPLDKICFGSQTSVNAASRAAAGPRSILPVCPLVPRRQDAAEQGQEAPGCWDELWTLWLRKGTFCLRLRLPRVTEVDAGFNISCLCSTVARNLPALSTRRGNSLGMCQKGTKCSTGFRIPFPSALLTAEDEFITSFQKQTWMPHSHSTVAS